MSSRPPRPLLCLILGFFASAAFAGKADDKALAKLEQAGAAQLKEFKTALAGHKGVLFASLDLLDGEVASSTGSVADAADLFDALATFAAAVGLALDTTMAAYATQAMGLLGDYHTAGGVGLPAGFVYGDRNGVDDFRAALEKEQAKTLNGVRKRIAKTIAKFDKELGVAVAARILPQPPREHPFDEFFAGSQGLTIPLVDVLVTASILGVDGDGALYAGGTANEGCGALNVIKADADGSFGTSVTPGADRRWSNVWTDQAEGNYRVMVLLCFSTGPAESIGLR